MLSHEEIVSSLTPLNGKFFTIIDINAYASKLLTRANSLEQRLATTGELIAYTLFYDNQDAVFISMVWTHPDHQGRGYAKNLLRRLIQATSKDIHLEVHADNPARALYRSLGFQCTSKRGEFIGMARRSALAVMQPYVFPHLGYFHLIQASNLFVFYDDVNYIKKGWINRNRIVVNGSDQFFTIPLHKASQNRLINETDVSIDDAWIRKFNQTLIHAYQKAPFFKEVHELIRKTLFHAHASIADLAIQSIANTYHYLELPFHYTRSSLCSPTTRGLDKAERLIQLCKQMNFGRYLNSPGGAKIYCKQHFKANGIELGFLNSEFTPYKQDTRPFTPSLSIIDVLMFNAPACVRKHLTTYEVI